MLSIRLSRKGKKKQPLYRVIICEKHKDPWGDYLENLGTFNPKTKEISLNIDRIKYWLSKGAQPSDTIWNMLVEKGVVEGKKKKVSKISKKRLAKKDDGKKDEVKKEEKVEQPADVKEEIVADKKESKAEDKPVEEPKKDEAPKEEPKKEENVEDGKNNEGVEDKEDKKEEKKEEQPADK